MRRKFTRYDRRELPHLGNSCSSLIDSQQLDFARGIGEARNPHSLHRRAMTADNLVFREGAFNLLHFRDPERLVFSKTLCDDLLAAGGPVYLDTIDLLCVAQAEVKWESALREVTGFTVIVFGIDVPSGSHTHSSAQPIPV